MFTKEERSTFPYWFAHWCAFNMTALNLKVWKPKYLLHDIEKPWLKLIWKDYSRVKEWHRVHNKHHWEYKDPSKIDWEAMVIDWECGQYTKVDGQETARELYEHRLQSDKVGELQKVLMRNKMLPILDKLGL
jgi:hypothetical protein